MTDDLQAARERKLQTMTCPSCGSQNGTESVEKTTFIYGDGKLYPAVELSAEVPVISCPECKESFMDGRAEDVRDAAVHKHLHARLQTLEAENARLRRALEYPRFGNTANLLDKAVEQIEKMSQRLNELRGENWVPFYVNHYANAAKEIRAALAPQKEDRP